MKPLVEIESVAPSQELHVLVWQLADGLGRLYFPNWHEVRPAAANFVWLLFRPKKGHGKKRARAA